MPASSISLVIVPLSVVNSPILSGSRLPELERKVFGELIRPKATIQLLDYFWTLLGQLFMLARLFLRFAVDKEQVDVGLAVDALTGLAIPHYLKINYNC